MIPNTPVFDVINDLGFSELPRIIIDMIEYSRLGLQTILVWSTTHAYNFNMENRTARTAPKPF